MKSQKNRYMARSLLEVWGMTFLLAGVLALSLVACVYPAPLELDTPDGGPSSVPLIISASPSEFAFPGAITLDRGDQRRLFLSLNDNDLEDTLHVRLYVDYGRPNENSQSGECAAAAAGEKTRVADCSISSLCTAIDPGDTSQHVLEALVADREFLLESNPLADGQPAFRALPSNAAFSIRSWLMECNPD
jgi:hypothetical protein